MQERLSSAGRIAGSALLISILPAVVAGQNRPVVSNQLAISQSEAALHLEFADNGTLDIALSDGSVMIDGEERGRFEQGDALDVAWRSLLSEIVSLSDGPLGEALQEWEAPASLADRAMDLARLLDSTLESALVFQDISASAEPSGVIDTPAQERPLGAEELANLSSRIRREIREELQIELRGELRGELREELRREFEGVRDRGVVLRAWDSVWGGFKEVLGSLITFLILSLMLSSP